MSVKKKTQIDVQSLCSDKTQFWYLSLNSIFELLAYQRSFFFKLNKNKPFYIYENNLCSYFHLDDKKPEETRYDTSSKYLTNQ